MLTRCVLKLKFAAYYSAAAKSRDQHKAIDNKLQLQQIAATQRVKRPRPQKRRPHCTTRAVIKSARGSTTMDPTRATSPAGNDTQPDLPHSMLFVPKFTQAREPRPLNRDGTPVDAVHKSSFSAGANASLHRHHWLVAHRSTPSSIASRRPPTCRRCRCREHRGRARARRGPGRPRAPRARASRT